MDYKMLIFVPSSSLFIKKQLHWLYCVRKATKTNKFCQVRSLRADVSSDFHVSCSYDAHRLSKIKKITEFFTELKCSISSCMYFASRYIFLIWKMGHRPFNPFTPKSANFKTEEKNIESRHFAKLSKTNSTT